MHIYTYTHKCMCLCVYVRMNNRWLKINYVYVIQVKYPLFFPSLLSSPFLSLSLSLSSLSLSPLSLPPLSPVLIVTPRSLPCLTLEFACICLCSPLSLLPGKSHDSGAPPTCSALPLYKYNQVFFVCWRMCPLVLVTLSLPFSAQHVSSPPLPPPTHCPVDSSTLATPTRLRC